MREPTYIIVDVESTGLHFMKDRLHGIGFMLEGDTEASYAPSWDIPDRLREALANPRITKVGHNLHAFDAKFIRRAGLQIDGEFDDTMVIWNLVDSDSPLGLKWLTEHALGKPENLDRKRELDRYIAEHGFRDLSALCFSDLTNPTHPHSEIISNYCKEDVENTYELREEGLRRLKEVDGAMKADGYAKGVLDYYVEEAKPLERVLFEIEWRGIRVDEKAITNLVEGAKCKRDECIVEMERLAKNKKDLVVEEIYQKKLSSLKTERGRSKVVRGEGKLAFEWNNPNHVASLLYDHCGITEQRTIKGQRKFDKVAIDLILSDRELKPAIRKFLEVYLKFRKQLKLLTTYAGDAEKGILSHTIRMPDGSLRIFPRFRQTTGTGRLACADPNLQNLPRDSEVKKFFIPDNPETEVFDEADYSQIELRVAAHVTGDPLLKKAYCDGIDVHEQTARMIFEKENVSKEERQVGKTTNFLTIYRGGAFRLQATLKAAMGKEFSLDECREFIHKWFSSYHIVDSYLRKQTVQFEREQKVVSFFGRLRYLDDVRFLNGIVDYNWDGGPSLTTELKAKFFKANPRRNSITNKEMAQFAKKLYNHALKAGYNMPIQGFAASLAKRSMIAAHNAGLVIANQVHDSIIIARKKNEPEKREKLISIMENVAKLDVPLKTDVKTLSSFHPDDKETD